MYVFLIKTIASMPTTNKLDIASNGIETIMHIVPSKAHGDIVFHVPGSSCGKIGMPTLKRLKYIIQPLTNENNRLMPNAINKI